MSYSRFDLIVFATFIIATQPLTTIAAGDSSISPNWPESYANQSAGDIQQPGSILSRTAMMNDEAIDTVCFGNDTCCGDCCDCGDGCDDVCCGSACCCNEKFLGLFAKSDHCYDGFISPMTNPVFFEDPRTLTELRTIFLYHKVPTAAGKGSIRLIAMQIRAALTDRLSLVAAKDGYIVSSNPLIENGWADLSLGLKYNLYADPYQQRLLSTGFSYELPTGRPEAAQGNGDGEYHIYLTGGTQLGDKSHWISASGFRLPSDPSAESSMWYWSNHFDRRLTNKIYALTELNWYHWTRSGTNTALAGVEGGDLFNFGSTNVAGNDIVTQAVGAKLVPNQNMEIGLAWEFPLTDRRDVLENRLTVDFILRY